VTDPAGSTLHFAYDAADRPIGTTYPDGTNIQIAYNLLDLVGSTDRLGQTTSYNYDADRELLKTTDALGHTVQEGYNLAGQLTSITDQNGQTTALIRDGQGRMITKQYADGTAVNFARESSNGLVAVVTDALGQTTSYTYNADNSIATVSYSANQPTAGVSFSYDPVYSRIASMSDGIGTTTYNYFPVTSAPALGANLLRSVTSPIAGSSGTDTVTYSYDALNRVVGYAVNGAAQSIGFDALGRITSASNPLDSFTYSYADATARITETRSNHGPTFAMTYFGPQGDELLQQSNVTAQNGTSLQQFAYTNNSDDIVTSFTSSLPTTETVSYKYDAANRLMSALVGTAAAAQYVYGYDRASNLTSIAANAPAHGATYTATNAITSGTYDSNGSPTALGSAAYSWDGANRLVGFTGAANNNSSFTYDGLGRLVRVVDTTNGSVTADHSYFWCGFVRCLAHDNTQSGSPVSSQYFGQGVISGGTSYYYVQDQLGSVRELVSASGTVAAQYDYDPYGNPTTLSGTAVSDIGYAGYFYHAASGLNFALYRAYDPVHGRWLNRDPAGEAGGVNLYGYVYGNPSSRVDPTGQFAIAIPIAIVVVGVVAACYFTNCAEGIENAIQAIQNSSKDPPAPPAVQPAGTTPADPCQMFPNSAECQQPDPPKSCPGSNRQFGKKFGEHVDANRPGYRTPQEYRDLANQLYNDPAATRTTYPDDADMYPGETHILDSEGNLLRLDPQGNFRSLYPMF
jgi:RHS repeat-associated protein